MFEAFLAHGIAGEDVGESCGSPQGRSVYSALYKELVENPGLAKRACLLARSRGGPMLYNWAVENPASVACIAGIYPTSLGACTAVFASSVSCCSSLSAQPENETRIHVVNSTAKNLVIILINGSFLVLRTILYRYRVSLIKEVAYRISRRFS